ncbi:hypothetical protein ABZ946_35675 [Streptomyces sp. NPDC046324]|uniref:hypothetical protein n=1 Tax=unclassified Streptomyces TaxID=2593676 RepID=UPI0033FEEA9C
MPQDHKQTPADLMAGSVTLCATRELLGGLQWAHLPVDRRFWVEDSLRQGFLARIWRTVGDPSAPVTVVERA